MPYFKITQSWSWDVDSYNQQPMSKRLQFLFHGQWHGCKESHQRIIEVIMIPLGFCRWCTTLFRALMQSCVLSRCCFFMHDLNLSTDGSVPKVPVAIMKLQWSFMNDFANLGHKRPPRSHQKQPIRCVFRIKHSRIAEGPGNSTHHF